MKHYIHGPFYRTLLTLQYGEPFIFSLLRKMQSFHSGIEQEMAQLELVLPLNRGVFIRLRDRVGPLAV